MKKQITGEYNAPLSKKIQLEYNKLSDIIATISLKDRIIKAINGTGGKVSVCDIIAYQIGWGTLLIEWYESGLQNKTIAMPGHGFSSWDYNGLALYFYKNYKFDCGPAQVKQFYTVVKRIIDIVESEYKLGNLDKTGIWAWCRLASGKEWPLSKWVTVNTVSPYKRAILLIRKFQKTI